MKFYKKLLRNRFIYLFLTILFVCSLNTAQAQVSTQAQIDTIINRYREYLFRVTQPSSADIRLWASSLNSASQWPDINYADTGPAKSKRQEHLDRVRQMAVAWAKPQSSYYQDEALWSTISSAIDFWLAKRFYNENWWHNEIGIPEYMRDIIITLRNQLAPHQLKRSLEILGQYRIIDSGGNMAWSANLGIHHAALTNDVERMERYIGILLKDIKINMGEGVQPDYSFHQHGPHLQMYQYGEAFLLNNARLAWQLRGTQWAFPKDKIDVLTDFVLKGWQWMARGINTVPGTMDRSATRKGELRSPDLRKFLPFLCELRSDKADEFKAMADRQNGKGEPLKGYRYYSYSDFSAYQRKGFSFFLKTISNRTRTTESINGENLKGRLLNSGDAYLIRNGNEYYNLMPLWNWEKLPGVTNFKGTGNISLLPFTGNVSNGKSGLAVMDYRLEGTSRNKSLSAHKFWAAHGDLVVCLIADIQTENIEDDVFTALDQSRWQGNVTVNKPGNILQEGEHHLESVDWIHHSGFAYIPLSPNPFNLNLNTVTGSWTSINLGESGEKPFTEKVFMPVMIHDIHLQGQSTGYVLALSKTPRQTEKLANKPTWKVLRNDKDCQAVLFDQMVMAAFFSPAILKIGKQGELKVDKPCAVMLEGDKLYISDPEHIGGIVKVNLNGRVMDIELPKDGTTVEKVLPEI